MPDTEVAKNKATEALSTQLPDLSGELGALRSNVESTQNEFETFKKLKPEEWTDELIEDYVETTFNSQQIDLSLVTEILVAKLPEGEYHQAYETEESDNYPGWKIKAPESGGGLAEYAFEKDDNGNYKLDTQGNKIPVKAYKGELELIYNWQSEMKRQLAKKFEQLTGVTLPPNDRFYNVFTRAIKKNLADKGVMPGPVSPYAKPDKRYRPQKLNLKNNSTFGIRDGFAQLFPAKTAQQKAEEAKEKRLAEEAKKKAEEEATRKAKEELERLRKEKESRDNVTKKEVEEAALAGKTPEQRKAYYKAKEYENEAGEAAAKKAYYKTKAEQAKTVDNKEENGESTEKKDKKTERAEERRDRWTKLMYRSESLERYYKNKKEEYERMGKWTQATIASDWEEWWGRRKEHYLKKANNALSGDATISTPNWVTVDSNRLAGETVQGSKEMPKKAAGGTETGGGNNENADEQELAQAEAEMKRAEGEKTETIQSGPSETKNGDDKKQSGAAEGKGNTSTNEAGAEEREKSDPQQDLLKYKETAEKALKKEQEFTKKAQEAKNENERREAEKQAEYWRKERMGAEIDANRARENLGGKVEIPTPSELVASLDEKPTQQETPQQEPAEEIKAVEKQAEANEVKTKEVEIGRDGKPIDIEAREKAARELTAREWAKTQAKKAEEEAAAREERQNAVETELYRSNPITLDPHNPLEQKETPQDRPLLPSEMEPEDENEELDWLKKRWEEKQKEMAEKRAKIREENRVLKDPKVQAEFANQAQEAGLTKNDNKGGNEKNDREEGRRGKRGKGGRNK